MWHHGVLLARTNNDVLNDNPRKHITRNVNTWRNFTTTIYCYKWNPRREICQFPTQPMIRCVLHAHCTWQTSQWKDRLTHRRMIYKQVQTCFVDTNRQSDTTITCKQCSHDWFLVAWQFRLSASPLSHPSSDSHSWSLPLQLSKSRMTSLDT